MNASKRILAFLLSSAMLLTATGITAFADKPDRQIKFFDDAEITDEMRSTDMFYLGSTNMEVSEKDNATYIMKVERGGSLDGEASVNVKFADVSTKYGENYEIGIYDGATVMPIEEQDTTSIVEFFEENKDTQEELIDATEEETRQKVIDNGGFSITNNKGEIVASALVEKDENGKVSGYDVVTPEGETAIEASLGEGDLQVNDEEVSLPSFSEQEYENEQEEILQDYLPGTEIKLDFKSGESVKYIAVSPLYSSEAEGDASAVVLLKEPSAGYNVPSATNYGLLIKDEDEGKKAVLSLEKDKYVVKANEDTVDIVVTRENAKNELVYANIVSYSDTADMGVDYQGIDAEVDFAPGMFKRTITLKVTHSDEDKEFKVKLLNPVGCELEGDSATVIIKKAENEGFSLMSGHTANGNDNEFLRRLGDNLDTKKFKTFNNTSIGSNYIQMSCKGRPYNEWESAEYYFDNPYIYDGVHLTWEDWFDHSWHPPYGSTSYVAIRTLIDGGQTDILNRSYTKATNIVSAIFNEKKANGFKFEILTSYRNGLQAKLYDYQPILREFEFALIDAAPLVFKNVGETEAKKYVDTQFGGCDSTIRTVTRHLGQSFTVSAPLGQYEYAKLDGLKILDNENHEICFIPNTTNSRSVTVNLNEEFMNTLTMTPLAGTKNIPSIDYSSRGNGCFLGKGIKIQPVFKYIDCTLTVKPNKYGYFNGDYKVTGNEQKFNLHLGDKLKLSTTIFPEYAEEYTGDGVDFELRDENFKFVKDYNSVGTYNYLSKEGMDFQLSTQNVVLTPKISIIKNPVVIKVLKTDAEKFKQDSGIFAIKKDYITSDESYNYYQVSDEHVYLDQFTFMNAEPKDSKLVAVWKVPNVEKAYSGSVFYYNARKTKDENIITLSVASAKTIDVKGLVYDSAKKLSTGIASSKPCIPSQGALVMADAKSTMVDDAGAFELSKLKTAEGTKARLLIYSNSTTTFKDIDLTESSSYDLGIVSAAVNSIDVAHFTNVYFTQDGRSVSSTETLKMNGKKLTLSVDVSDGHKYKYEGETRVEKVKSVTFYVLDGATNEIKSKYAAKKGPDNTWTAEILKFNPESPDKYTYGDVIYVSMTTDRPSGVVDHLDADDKAGERLKETSYSLISTGFEIVQDTSYKPQSINLNLDAGASAVSNGKTKNFAEIPFIGALNFLCGFSGILKFTEGSEADPEDDDESGYDPSSGSKARLKFRIIAKFSKLPYGGTRFTIGLSASLGNVSSRNSVGDNPVDSLIGFKDNYKIGEKSASDIQVQVIQKDKIGVDKTSLFGRTGLGSPMMVFSVAVGIYVDFGLIQERNIESGKRESSELVFIGAGGFLSIGGSIEVQSLVVIPVVNLPGFYGAIGEATAALYLGANKDVGHLIKYNTFFDEEEEVNLNKLKFNVDVFAKISIKGYIGIGIADVLGARIIAGFSLDYSLSPRLKDSFKAINSKYGLGLNFTVGGQFDFVFLSIPFDGFSIPLKNWGFTEYFVEVGRAKQLCIFTGESITNGRGKNLDEATKNTIREKIKQVYLSIKLDESVDEITSRRKELLALSDQYSLLNKTERRFCTIMTSPFLSLTGMDGSDGEASITEPTRRKHVDSVWVGGEPEDYFSLNGAFKEAKTNVLQKNSISQPEARIISLGKALNGHEKLLSLFLMDVSNQGDVEKTNIAYSVYDCTDKTWTEPKLLPRAGLYQYTPSVNDIGDDIIVTAIENLNTNQLSEEPTLAEELQSFDVMSLTISKDDLREGRDVTNSFNKLSEETAFYRNPSVAYVSKDNEAVAFYTKNTSKSSNIYDYLKSDPETTSIVYTVFDPTSGKIKESEKKIPILNEEEAIFNFSAKSDKMGNIIFSYVGTKDNETFNLYAGKLNLKEEETTIVKLPISSSSINKPNLYFLNKEREDIVEGEEDETVTVPGDVILTWMQDQGDLLSFNLSYFFNHDVDEDGNIRTEIKALENDIEYIFQKDSTENSLVITDNYDVVSDEKGNIYVVWSNTVDNTAEGEEFDIVTPPARELYAIAYTNDEYAGKDTATWSKPYRLTYSGHCNDGFSSAISSDGTMFVVHNQYDMIYVGGTETYNEENSVDENGYMSGNPYKVSATNLCLTELDPIGTVEAKKIELSTIAPKNGDNVSIDITFENTGLTSASGFSASVDLYKNGAFVSNIDNINTDETLRANSSVNKQVIWKNTSDSVEGMQIRVTAKENNYTTEYTSESEELKDKPIITLGSIGIYQDDLWDTEDGMKAEESNADENFTLAYYALNDGNVDLTNAKLQVSINPQYQENENYYFGKDKVLAEVPVETVKADDYGIGYASFSLPIEIFDVCGYESVDFVVLDEEGNNLSDIMTDYVVLQTPYAFDIEGGDEINLTVGKSKTLKIINSSEFLDGRDDIVYWSENPDVVSVKNNVITAKKQGTTKVYAYSSVYGTKDSINVVVTASGNEKKGGSSSSKGVSIAQYNGSSTIPVQESSTWFVDVPETAWYKDVVKNLVEAGIMKGISENTFEPETDISRAQFVTMLYRLDGESAFMNENIFSDVEEGSYYEKAVVWANGKDIVRGVSDTEFAPNEKITREQIATILYRYAIYKGIDVEKAIEDTNTLSYNDIFEVSDWASTAVHFCLATGIMKGDDNGNVLPHNNAKRVEAGAMLIRYRDSL